MFGKSKISQSMIDAVKSVVEDKVENQEEILNEASPIKEPTSTGMRVYGRSYGNSAKAKQDQTKKDIDNLKGPKDKEVKEELKGNQDKIDANHNDKIDAQDFKILRGKKKVKEETTFASKLMEKIKANITEKKDVVMPEEIRKSDVPAYLRKAKGDTPLTVADVKAPKKDSISAPENLAKARNEEYDKNKDPDFSNAKKDVADSRLAQAAKKKLAKEEVENIEERDEGKPGKMFKKIAAKAAERYGSQEAGNRVAGAIRKKVLAKEEIESLDEEQVDEMINEVLSKDASAGDWIHDFVHSDNPKFAGKSKAERKKMALGAYYGAQKEAYEASDAPVTTDTLAGRLPGGKSNAFKSYKLRVKPLAKETGENETPDAREPEETTARKSIKAEATIAGTPGWEPMKKDVKDKSGAVHTPMSRAKDLARQAFKNVQNKTKIK